MPLYNVWMTICNEMPEYTQIPMVDATSTTKAMGIPILRRRKNKNATNNLPHPLPFYFLNPSIEQLYPKLKTNNVQTL